MRLASFSLGLGVALFGLIATAPIFIAPATAQSFSVPSYGGGGIRGGGDFEDFDPCEFGDCYRPPRRLPPRPRVTVIPDYYDRPAYNDYYEEDLGPAEPRPRRATPQVRPEIKKVTPKKAPPKKKPPTGSTASASITQGEVAGRDYRPDEVLVEIPLTLPQSDIDALAQQHRIEQLGSQEISLLNTRIHRWRILDGRSVNSVASAIRADRRVAGAYPNRIFSLQEGRSAAAGPPQYASAKLKLPEVHSLTKGNAVLVAVIDSGADGNHPELAGAIEKSFDAIGGTFTPHAHGTGMAGVIAAHDQLNGVAPQARILDVRAFAPNGTTNDGTTFDVVRGMDWAVQQGARVFNLSFAGPRDPLLSRVVKAALDKGIVVVAAAGNAGPKSPPLYPANDPGVIAVTATDAADGVMKMANRGRFVTLAAPGVDILLPAPEKAYAVSTGTSIATAYVSGVAALLIAHTPEADSKEVYEVLTGTARDLGSKGRDHDFGAGFVEPLAALTAMEPIAQTVAVPAEERPVQ